MKPSILIIYTGGTIGMIKDSDSGLLKPFDVENVLDQIPQLRRVSAKIDAISTANPKDSANMCPADWQEIGQLIYDNYQNYSGFVVLHGTDTMAYTTSAVSFMFQNLGKPIVFTGSQLPIGDIRTDALENVLTAIETVLLEDGNGNSLINEVCLYFGNKLYRGNCVTKISSVDFDAFVSPNVEPLAISNLKLEVNHSILLKRNEKKIVFNPLMEDAVFVYKIHPGITKKQFEQICDCVTFKVLILESYGSGTIFNTDWFIDSLKGLLARNVKIINISQCVFGNVEEVYEVSKVLSALNLINGRTLTLESSIAKSMCLLGNKIMNDEFNARFVANTAGEF